MQTVYATPKTNLQQLFDCLAPHTTVVLQQGTYYQKAILSVSDVTLQGNGAVITYDDYAKKLDGDGLELTTFKSYTLAITSDNVTLQNLTICNTAGNPSEKGQEVALYVCGTNFKATNCTFVSTQDTVFCGPLPDDLVVRYDGFLPTILRYREGQTFQLFQNCKIEGTVDFIFGCANALFDNCEIVSADDGRDIGYVAAPAHHLANSCGFVFHHCNLVCQTNATVYLARAWRDFGKVTFIDCTYDKHIAEDGFINWQGTNRQRTARFAEYTCKSLPRPDWTKQLTKDEAENFLQSVQKFFKF